MLVMNPFEFAKFAHERQQHENQLREMEKQTELLKKQTKDAKEAAERVAREAAKPAKSPEHKQVGAKFCHKCGQSAQANDKFCSGCGTPLRGALPSGDSKTNTSKQSPNRSRAKVKIECGKNSPTVTAAIEQAVLRAAGKQLTAKGSQGWRAQRLTKDDLKRVTSLNLSNLGITDLAPIARFEYLLSLGLNGNPSLTVADIKKLKKKLPMCAISSNPPK